MSDLPICRSIRHREEVSAAPMASVTLGYDERMLRRKRLQTDDGFAIFVDLSETVSLSAGDCFLLADGRLVEVRAAPEAVLKITGRLPRLAWHIGNRHTPCEILADHLLIREDHVLEAMLRHLGAGIERVVAPFSPEGGAYGHGRTMGHDHGHGHALGHGHAHDHDH
ncbi:MAG: urease accessory protein UreE [Rhodobacteraceae bacterium]|nr:urease accessory protein UreE [Paracoccaceae bacterium]